MGLWDVRQSNLELEIATFKSKFKTYADRVLLIQNVTISIVDHDNSCQTQILFGISSRVTEWFSCSTYCLPALLAFFHTVYLGKFYHFFTIYYFRMSFTAFRTRLRSRMSPLPLRWFSVSLTSGQQIDNENAFSSLAWKLTLVVTMRCSNIFNHRNFPLFFRFL